ncbi:MAG: DUF1266 domain-containing protein [Angelakisella sp.]|jgi:hypothetical protein|nr:DUF1266 domain-containing protein [Angelakisella sp.]
MAHYKVSNRNLYGFRDHLLQSLVLAAVLTILLSLLTSLFIGPLLYRLSFGGDFSDDGGAGGEASWKTPVAESIQEMKQHQSFTLITTGTVLNSDALREDGAVYYRIPLPNGECVAARINRKAIQEMGTIGFYRLPVGRWRDWKAEEVPPSIAALSGTIDTSGYVDMLGNHRGPMEESDYSQTLVSFAAPLIFFGVTLIHRFWGIRQGRFAPAFLERMDPLLPRNDLECWCAALSAHHFSPPEWEGWPLLTGGHRSRKTKDLCKEILADCQVSGADQGIREVRRLTDDWAGSTETDGGAWDLCRAIRLLEAMYLLDLLERNELDLELGRVGRVLQRRFSSWEAFLADEEQHYKRDPSLRQKLALRREAILQMKDQHYSPYLIPWYTDLTWAADGSTGERTVVKTVLSKQFVRR